jgi:predicted dehydrogenase
MTAIRTIHVGVRGRGRWPLELMAADPRFEPVAIVGREPDALGAECGVAGLDRGAVFTDLRAALDAVACEAVVVCTPVELHARDLRVAFAAGKHVLVEKCLTNVWTEACALVAEADAAGVELVVAQNYRFTATNQTLHHAVTSGGFGTPMLIDLALHKYRPAPRQQDYPFAMFWDQGCHHVDVLQWVFGPIAEVSARTFSAPWSRYRDDAAIQALLRFESGAVWTYLLSNVARVMDHRFLVQSEAGALRLEGERWRWHAAAAGEDDPFGWNDAPLDVPDAPGIPASGEHGVLDAFARALAGAATPISGRANLETLRVCEMVRRAGEAGRPVTRDEVTCTT